MRDWANLDNFWIAIMEYASFKDWLESNIVGRFTEEIETKIWDLYSEGKTTELYNELTKLGFQGAE